MTDEVNTPGGLPALPARDPQGHKGTFGTVCVVGGCASRDVRMIGAAALAAEGALRAGCGLVRLCMPEPILDEALSIAPSATGLPIEVDAEGGIEAHVAAGAIDRCLELCDCLVVGPGMGRSAGTGSAALRAVQQEERHVVVDADALNALSETPELFRDFHASAVLTPHPGEYRRLAGALNISTERGADPTRDDERPRAAELLAQRLGCIVVLKGAGTVVSDGQRSWRCSRVTAALATAGTGDVLGGVIAGLCAQFTPPPRVSAMMAMAGGRGASKGRPLDLFQASCLAVEAHALAAEVWVERAHAGAGMTAMELARCVPEAMERLRGGG